MISKHDAILVFILSFFCLAPYINLFISPLVLIFGIQTMKKIKANPTQFGGYRYVLVAIIMSSLTILLSYPVVIYQAFF